ncbi:hypothetical protein Asppvi_002029 [Aspergillus pseudoviridinutans]|uniref:Thioesterase domain-containing protein n=1 Tax=Aspergillus pseudoviridinutans TaxID=1517512 RepID=A0A9P3BSA1_9EURO|nr:uncharacterized protein Asppvi_002029 [Aspergillus pseudoviridinutans]GIJ92751.1 hypothetical protein Asppvi_002029 [Aspergillus pseudoviridinutans]
MSRTDMHLPRTPVLLPAQLETSTPEDADSSSGSSSTSICSCWTSPLLGEPTHPADPITEHGLYPYTDLEEGFLRTLTIFSATPLHAQAVATAPHDHRVTRHWLLIELLSHRIFSTFPEQGAIRKLSTSYYEPVGPGDVLFISARPVTEKSLRWCEATITRENMLVAIVTALYDGPPVGTRGDAWLRRSEDLLDQPDSLETSSLAPGHE